jgi:hypothetical protein
MTRLVVRSIVGVFLLLVCLAAQVSAGQALVRFLPPHTASLPQANVAPAIVVSLRARLGTSPVLASTLTEAVLAETDARLHFGLSHRTKLELGAREREGNCIEYAQLFTTLFDRIAMEERLSARAYAVHSAKAQVLGQRVPLRGWGDHDWVLVVDGASRRYLDPTRSDLGLAADIADAVVGGADIALPR